MPIEGTTLKIYGGDGDDIFETNREQDSTIGMGLSPVLYGQAGNDKMTMHQFAGTVKGYGGTGDDKIVFFNNMSVTAAGNEGDDILYGGDGEGSDGAMTT